MPKGKTPHELPERMREQLSNEQAGWHDFVEEYEPYVENNPDDTWARGQLQYARKRLKFLTKKLGLANNRRLR